MPGMRQTTHTVEPVYAPPVLRAPSPTDSIDTEYGAAETTEEHLELSDEEFAKLVEERIGLRCKSWEDARSPTSPVILPRTKDDRQEQMMFDAVMRNLRERVKELEDEEIFNTVLRNTSGPAFFAPQPSARDVESIMLSMLPSSKPTPASVPSIQNAHAHAPTYPAARQPQYSNTPSFPSSFTAQMSRTTINGETSGRTVTGPPPNNRYGNLGRGQR